MIQKWWRRQNAAPAQEPGVFYEKLPDPETRYVLTFVSAVVAFSFTVGPASWRQSPLYPLLAEGHVRVQWYGIGLWVAVILLVLGTPLIRMLGFILSAVAFSTFFLILAAATDLGTNNKGITPIGLCMYLGIALLNWLSAYRVSRVLGSP